MATFTITAPDGNTYEITAPEGATEAQVLEYAKANYAKTVASPKEAPSGFVQGVMDPIYGAGQLLAKGMQYLPESLTVAGRPVAASAKAFAEKVEIGRAHV